MVLLREKSVVRHSHQELPSGIHIFRYQILHRSIYKKVKISHQNYEILHLTSLLHQDTRQISSSWPCRDFVPVFILKKCIHPMHWTCLPLSRDECPIYQLNMNCAIKLFSLEGKSESTETLISSHASNFEVTVSQFKPAQGFRQWVKVHVKGNCVIPFTFR